MSLRKMYFNDSACSRDAGQTDFRQPSSCTVCGLLTSLSFKAVVTNLFITTGWSTLNNHLASERSDSWLVTITTFKYPFKKRFRYATNTFIKKMLFSWTFQTFQNMESMSRNIENSCFSFSFCMFVCLLRLTSSPLLSTTALVSMVTFEHPFKIRYDTNTNIKKIWNMNISAHYNVKSMGALNFFLCNEMVPSGSDGRHWHSKCVAYA